MNEETALGNALNKINAETYKWEIPIEETYIKEFENNPEATFYPKGELVYFPVNSELILAYKFNIYAHTPVSRADYYM